MRASPTIIALTAAAGLMALAPGAFAQDGETRSEGGGDVRLSGRMPEPAPFDPIEVEIPALLSPAGEAGRSLMSGPSDADDALRLGDGEPSVSAQPWYQRFTGAPVQPQILWGEDEVFQVEAGERWGVTLGYNQVEHRPQDFDYQNFNAGAFFELTERVRLGGQLRFTSPEEQIFGAQSEEKAPEIRFESAFKF